MSAFGIGPTSTKEEVLAAVAHDYCAFFYAPPSLRGDKDIAIAAVRTNGLMLAYATPQIQEDRDVVLAAVRNTDKRDALQFAAPALRNDKQIILAAIRNYGGYALIHAPLCLRRDRDFIIHAVKQHPRVLDFCMSEHRKNRDVVLAAVETCSFALTCTSEALRDDKELVLAAVYANGEALKHASKRLKRDRQVVLAAVKNGGAVAFDFAVRNFFDYRLLRSWAKLTRLERTKRKVRETVKLRAIALYWEKCAVERSHAPGGAGRKRDLDAFKVDFAEAS
jgi:hypothetical protein